jgi:hypothetical protein
VRGAGAERCIAPTQLATRVEALTGPVFASSADSNFVIEARIEAHGDGFRATIGVSDRRGLISGVRTLDEPSSDCRKLDEALAFVVAVTVDPTLASAQLPEPLRGMFNEEPQPDEVLLTEVPGRGPVSEPSVSPPAAQPPIREAERPKTRVPLTFAGGGALSALAFSAAMWGFALRIEAEVARRVQWVLAGQAFPFSHAERSTTGTTVRVRQGTLSTSICPRSFELGALRVSPCASALLRVYAGRGAGFARNDRALLWVPALGLALGVQLPLAAKVGVAVDILGFAGLVAPRFVARSQAGAEARVAAPQRFGIDLLLGLYVRI